MLALAINGSPRRDSNSAIMLEWVLEELAARGIETEIYHLAGKPLRGCIDCGRCFITQDKHCNVRSDAFNEVLDRILAADAVIIGAPSQFGNVPSDVKALIERVGVVDTANGCMLTRKVGAGVIAARRGGATEALNAINHLYLRAEMIVPGSSYWNVGYAPRGYDVRADNEAERTMRALGRNMAWLLHCTVDRRDEE